ncbi:hypothetical protein [Marimonas arenosa]|uniref:Uncharacterized protein n=1 Tax=Marimonas arenosa TaxID=1795305 RepID=A0AAE3WG70_9RHOB|nr:hypothetical protein [Marimonas arenosa]MDQ2091157.1 hypothetical protein [Marimonas arenosa]
MQNNTFNTYNDVTNALDAARKARKVWEQGVFASSNEKLRALLVSAFDIFQACVANPDLTGGITELLKHFNLKHSKNTSLELKIVRLVFADETTQHKHKQRLLSYARVLTLAHEDNQTPATLDQYIQDKGGIDEIRRTKSGKSNELKAQQYATVAKKQFANTPETGLFDAFKLPPELKPANGNRYSLALVRDNQDGTGTIVHGLNTNSLVEKALEEVGKVIAKQVGEQAAQSLLTGASQHHAAAISEAMQTVNSAYKPELSLGEPVPAAE